ncbi:uncharacterized protein FA14DRAFT_157980 [Meira miltonrushii]|uniref:Uncharacterized protein n=1 Tax=Meira miltonrushii TaxID=1280837 RepID=A0A316V3B7_9BASI|nr:uncharacterized protein FA14DRAFT_157980 [Meira miltonrushii]PWN32049.1 hypothetical protein FA14DRAFT_157980 [Meira miltonrushii]
MSILSPPSKPSKWRLSNRLSKRSSEATMSEIRFSPISDPNKIPPEKMSSLIGYSINPAFSNVFTGSRTNEAILSTIASTDLTKLQRRPRKPSVNDEAALYQAIRHLSEIGSKDEYNLTMQELYAWRTAVNIAYMTFTEDGVVPLASFEDMSKPAASPSTKKPSLAKSKSFNIPRKPVPSSSGSIPELPHDLSKNLNSRHKAPRKYSLPTSGHNPLIHSPKLRSGLPIGQMHALKVDTNVSPGSYFGPNAATDWTRSPIKPNENSIIQSPLGTSSTSTFDMNEWSMVTPRANTTKYPRTSSKDAVSQLAYISESGEMFNRFTREECGTSKLKGIPDVSGEMEKTYTYSDYGDGDDGDGRSSLDHSNPTNSDHSSPRTEEAHLQQLGLSLGTNTQKSPQYHHHHQMPSPSKTHNSDSKQQPHPPPAPRIRVPLNTKRSFQDQRWAPGSRDRISAQDDSDDDDDYLVYSTTKKPIRKASQTRKNDMLGMLDFLSSGPPE